MNDTGFMFEVLDDYALDFIRYSGECDGEVLELGCAYGVATITALEAGAKVRACDIDQRHLDILLSRVPGGLEPQLKTELQRRPMPICPTINLLRCCAHACFTFLLATKSMSHWQICIAG